MKHLNLLSFLLFISISVFSNTSDFEKFLKAQSAITNIEQISGNRFFEETYIITIRQPLEHTDTTKGFFNQRVFVANNKKEKPVVLITEGYAAEYAGRPNYINELTPMFDANQICVEHRYFGESWPDSLNWEYLTVSNAAADHHKVVELFKKYYHGKWINTGISKGGQTAVYHRTYYPNDVNVTIAYVCPLNFGVSDGRHEPFIRNIPGTSEQRQKIEAFQIEILKNREKLLPELESFTKKKNLNFLISMDELFDYCVLEYPFSLWQWGGRVNEIPSKEEHSDVLFKHLIQVSDPQYFSVEGIEGIKSFFVQAARELGYYGYDSKSLRKYLSIGSSKNYLKEIFLPKDIRIKYKKKTAREVKTFIDSTDKNILFIYGEFDPWSASGFNPPHKSNLLKVIKPGGSHSTRITNLPAHQKEITRNKLEEWLEMSVVIK